jgi:hypothetical protein
MNIIRLLCGAGSKWITSFTDELAGSFGSVQPFLQYLVCMVIICRTADCSIKADEVSRLPFYERNLHASDP